MARLASGPLTGLCPPQAGVAPALWAGGRGGQPIQFITARFSGLDIITKDGAVVLYVRDDLEVDFAIGS